MRNVLVRYRVKPDQVAENEQLVRAVYEELHHGRPDGFHYATFKLEDGVSFVHIAIDETTGESPLTGLPAFQRFQQDIAERCDEPPVVSTVDRIGSYEFA